MSAAANEYKSTIVQNSQIHIAPRSASDLGQQLPLESTVAKRRVFIFTERLHLRSASTSRFACEATSATKTIRCTQFLHSTAREATDDHTETVLIDAVEDILQDPATPDFAFNRMSAQGELPARQRLRLDRHIRPPHGLGSRLHQAGLAPGPALGHAEARQSPGDQPG
ncbi:hypothetical protein DL771_000975 [Monosporascus sp. 5C6A]|nr:hypothetical protein DL771_000975 [Monosporascus sp. 5C6A]